MKKPVIVLAFASLFLSLNLTSCSSPADDVSDAQEEVDDAQNELDVANMELDKDMKAFRKKTFDKIADNKVQIAELKLAIEKDKSAMKTIHQKQIVELQARNNDLKMRLDNYNGEGEDKWEDFKKELDHDMNEIGNSLKDLTVSNTK
jgi:phosphoenolpyruvate-protein kinase (PTS system EI component)